MEVGDEAVEIANEIQALVAGRSTAAVYMAVAMVLGAAEARAKRPDLDGLIRIIGDGAREEFDRVRPN
jgi:hypothetical protein